MGGYRLPEKSRYQDELGVHDMAASRFDTFVPKRQMNPVNFSLGFSDRLSARVFEFDPIEVHATVQFFGEYRLKIHLFMVKSRPTFLDAVIKRAHPFVCTGFFPELHRKSVQNHTSHFYAPIRCETFPTYFSGYHARGGAESYFVPPRVKAPWDTRPRIQVIYPMK